MKNRLQITISVIVISLLFNLSKGRASNSECYKTPHDSLAITVPNIFTPNGDGINDTWSMIAHDYGVILFDLQTIVYDRWGVPVFQSTDIREVWLGHTPTGRTCAAGSYFYVISYTNSITNQKETLKGFLELLR